MNPLGMMELQGWEGKWCYQDGQGECKWNIQGKDKMETNGNVSGSEEEEKEDKDKGKGKDKDKDKDTPSTLPEDTPVLCWQTMTPEAFTHLLPCWL
ncbi:hypothetical protein HGM15179_021548 [Zosterops borbonicus]|uniref:Uncharacterized protein n=1 Tax=Zosterops borbonicus TaxID=364589 RepID=A0A8K1FTX8_9PASS|nr:hypothetical protein HGM15179_021548 [Zosterops borbonicus]